MLYIYFDVHTYIHLTVCISIFFTIFEWNGKKVQHIIHDTIWMLRIFEQNWNFLFCHCIDKNFFVKLFYMIPRKSSRGWEHFIAIGASLLFIFASYIKKQLNFRHKFVEQMLPADTFSPTKNEYMHKYQLINFVFVFGNENDWINFAINK